MVVTGAKAGREYAARLKAGSLWLGGSIDASEMVAEKGHTSSPDAPSRLTCVVRYAFLPEAARK